jgi:NAD(P)-dependent dehydrogenase (short-subunit alcohol dehydrogenase family)
MNRNLANRTAGNGKAAAVAYARAGANVVAVDFDAAAAQRTVAIIEQEGGRSLAIQADASDSAAVKRACDASQAEFGGIDILHNNVGICLAGDPITLSEADWDRSMNCNVKGVFLALKHALPGMLERGRGVVTNISSILSRRVSRYDEIAYYASKAAVDHLTRAVAVKYAARGIRCNAILPGLMHTPLLYANPDVVEQSHGSIANMIAERNATSPTGKMGEAWDIAHAAVFLASDEAKYINGVLLPVDGGLICKQA